MEGSTISLTGPTKPAATGHSATVPARWNRREGIVNDTEGPAGPDDGTGETQEMRKLGKLNKAAYTSWDNFLRAAEARMGVVFPESAFESGGGGKDTVLEKRLETLHTWRCLLGQVVEAVLLDDRLVWIKEQLEETQMSNSFQCSLVNLFDQATGSGRNVAIVIGPSTCMYSPQSQ